MKNLRAILLATTFSLAAIGSAGVLNSARAETADDLNKESNQALQMLYKSNPAAKVIAEKATAILVFPKIIKAGLVFGGAFGEGEMKQGAAIDGYYNSVTGSWGLQAGAQSYGYVVFLMKQSAVDYIHKSAGFEVGVGPTVVVVNQGVAENLSTSTLKDDAYAFIFDQEGLMLGISIEGTKISKIKL
jgi:lipid-binding SYLF domain-containing protein